MQLPSVCIALASMDVACQPTDRQTIETVLKDEASLTLDDSGLAIKGILVPIGPESEFCYVTTDDADGQNYTSILVSGVLSFVMTISRFAERHDALVQYQQSSAFLRLQVSPLVLVQLSEPQ